MSAAAPTAAPALGGVVSHEEALALLRLAVDVSEGTGMHGLGLPSTSPARLVHLALRIHELGERLLPLGGRPIGHPGWSRALDHAVRLVLMDGRDEAALADGLCCIGDQPVNEEWLELEKLIADEAKMLLRELQRAGRFEGDEPC